MTKWIKLKEKMKKHITLFAIFLLFNANMRSSSSHSRTWITPEEKASIDRIRAERNEHLQRSHRLYEAQAKFDEQADDACLGLTAFCGGAAFCAALSIFCLEFCNSTSEWLQQRNMTPSRNTVPPRASKKMK